MASGHVVRLDRLVGVVADAARAAHEQHRDVGDARHRHRVVAGAARQLAHRSTPVAATASATRSTSAGVHGVARLLGDRRPAPRRSPRRCGDLGRRPPAARSIAASRTASSWWRMSSVTSARARDHVDRAVRDVELADRRDQPRLRAGDALGGEHELGGRGGGVAAQVHRRRAGVAGVAREGEVEAALAGDRGDDAERQALGLEHRALLDVDLEVGARRRRRRAARRARPRSPRRSVTPSRRAGRARPARARRRTRGCRGRCSGSAGPSSSAKATTSSGASGSASATSSPIRMPRMPS